MENYISQKQINIDYNVPSNEFYLNENDINNLIIKNINTKYSNKVYENGFWLKNSTKLISREKFSFSSENVSKLYFTTTLKLEIDYLEINFDDILEVFVNDITNFGLIFSNEIQEDANKAILLGIIEKNAENDYEELKINDKIKIKILNLKSQNLEERICIVGELVKNS